MVIVQGDVTSMKAWKNMQVGGVHLFARRNDNVFRNTILDFQYKMKIPLFVTVDLEGCVNPFKAYKRFPAASDIFEVGSAYEKGFKEGQFLADLGVNLNFAPVVDLDDEIWKCRSFPGDEQEIAEKAEAYALGLQNNGVIATIKHYPGKTLVVRDPHKFIVNANIAEEDVHPYKYLFEKNEVKAMMISHIITDGEVDSKGIPSVVSKKVIDEIKHCVENYGIKEISFWDDTMSYHKKWMKEFCNLLIDSKLDLIWSCYAAINTVNKEILELMAKAGCWNIFYGYETGVESLAKNIKTDRKNKSMEHMMEVTKWTKDVGIEIRGSFIIALPGETPELAEQTIKDAIKLDPEYAQFSITTPFPGTALYNEIKEGKWGKLVTEDFTEYQGWNVVFLPKGYESPKQVIEMSKKAFRSFYLRPKYIYKAILRIRSFEDIKRYFRGFYALVRGYI